MKPIIVGIDIGLTSAFAILDLNGKLIEIYSERRISYSKFIRKILKNGMPIILAIDKARPSNKIKKIKAGFGCDLYLPDYDLKIRDKNKIIGEIATRNLHERDAAACALFAYRSFHASFLKIERRLSAHGLDGNSELVKKMILKGEINSLADAIKKL